MAFEQLELEVIEEGLENSLELCTCCSTGNSART